MGRCQQLAGRGHVQVTAIALPDRSPGKLQAEPGEIVEDPLLRAVRRPLRVRIVDAQQQLTAQRLRRQRVGNRHHGGAEMERARGRRGETQARSRHAATIVAHVLLAGGARFPRRPRC